MRLNSNSVRTQFGGIYGASRLVTILLLAAALSAAGQVTYVKTYSNFILHSTLQKDVTPETVQATADGGYIFLASTNCPTDACVMGQGNTNPTVNWLVKTDSFGSPQWETELGCFNAAPGDYTIGVSLAQTTDGGYIVGGGELNEAASCGTAGNEQRAIVEKLDSAGNLTWSKTYAIGPYADGITAIEQTADGGFVAAGGVYEAGPSPGAGLVLKLDGSGNVQWQTMVGPMSSATAWLLAIQQTSDGGYLAAGNYYISSQCPPLGCQAGLVVKLDSSGNVQWQKALNVGTGNTQFITSIVQASDGGYVAAGAWFGSTQKGGLLVKLDSSGNILWQNAYSGGSYFGEELGVFINSVRQTSDGGYFLAGDGDVVLLPSGVVELVPWLGRADSSGNLVWANFYFQLYAPTGLPLSEYFAGGDVAQDGGFVAVGLTEDYLAQRNLLFVVKTDRSGLCGICADVYPDTMITTVNPGLTISTVSPPIRIRATPGKNSPSNTRSTAIVTKKDCPEGRDLVTHGDGAHNDGARNPLGSN